jgi:hypothetical protein
LAQESCQRKDDLFLSVEPCGVTSLSPAVLIEQDTPANPSSNGSEKILTYKEYPHLDTKNPTPREETHRWKRMSRYDRY